MPDVGQVKPRSIDVGVFHWSRSPVSVSSYRSTEVSSPRPRTRLDNTYRLEPCTKFPAEMVQLLIKQILEKYLQHEEYKSDLCRLMAKQLSEVRKHHIFFISYRLYVDCILWILQNENFKANKNNKFWLLSLNHVILVWSKEVQFRERETEKESLFSTKHHNNIH